MQVISKTDFIKKFDDKKGAVMLSVSLETVPKMNKTDVATKTTVNPYLENTTKTITLSGIAGFNYEDSVNRQLIREGKADTFIASPLAWGVHYNQYLIENKGKFYVQLKVQGSRDPVYRHNGETIHELVLKPFIPKRSGSAAQAEEEIDKEIIVRTVSIEIGRAHV